MQTDSDKVLLAYFTDVEYLLDTFKNCVAAPTLPKRILVIHGVGGVGKSSLLRMFRLHCKSVNVSVALASGDEAKSALDVLVRWTDDLKADGVAFPTFGKTYEHYCAIQAKVNEQAKKAQDAHERAANIAGKAASKMAEAAGGALAGAAIGSVIPGIGTAIGATLGGVVGGMGVEALTDWLLSRGFKKPDIDLLLDPTKRITEDFLSDIEVTANKRRIVLMLDTFEQMTALDDWVRDVAQRLHSNALLVIAGRALPNWSRTWDGWMATAQVEELKPMTEDVMRDLVRRYYATMRGGQPNPTQVDAIIRFARGLPMVVTSAVQLWVKYGVEDFQSVKTEIVANLVDRLMEGVPNVLIPALEAAAIVRWFDQPILRAVTGLADVRDVYNELRRFPFVRVRAEGLALHDAVREIMDENLRAQDSERHCELHERAAAYFEKRWEKVADVRLGWRGEETDQAMIELLYHRILVSEIEGINYLERIFYTAGHLWQLELQRKLLDEALHHVFLEPMLQSRLEFLVAQTTNDWKKQECQFKVLLDKPIDDVLRAKVLGALTAPLAYQGKSEEARNYLREALTICDRQEDRIAAAWTRLELCWQVGIDEGLRHIEHAIAAFEEAGDTYGFAMAKAQLGWNNLNRWEANKAREAFSQSMVALEKLHYRHEVAFVKERLGQTYLIEGDFWKAITLKEQALKVFQDLQDKWSVAWTLHELAVCYNWIGRWEHTIAILERARRIFNVWGDHRETDSVVAKASIYRRQSRLEHAMELYKEVLESLPRYTPWTMQELYAGIASIYLTEHECEKAWVGYQQAIDEFRSHGFDREADLVGGNYLGDWHLTCGEAAKAVEQYSLCLKMAQSLNTHAYECQALVGICQAYYLLGDFDKVKINADQAEKIGQSFSYYAMIADINSLRGFIAFDQSQNGNSLPLGAFQFFSASLKYSLLYNRYKLDRTTQTVISHCLERSEEGQRMLIALRDWWNTSVNDIGAPRPDTISPIPEDIALLEAERIAREREPGDGSPQKSVVEQIEAAL